MYARLDRIIQLQEAVAEAIASQQSISIPIWITQATSLQGWMDEANTSVKELAGLAQVSEQTIRQALTGKRALKRENRIKIAKELSKKLGRKIDPDGLPGAGTPEHVNPNPSG